MFRTQQEALDIQDLQELTQMTLFSLAYTRLEQVVVLWTGQVTLMFVIAKFALILAVSPRSRTLISQVGNAIVFHPKGRARLNTFLLG